MLVSGMLVERGRRGRRRLRAAARGRRLEADGWAGLELGMIRLAVRVPRSHAEPVLAELLELVPAGLEERDVDADTVEYALYGAPGELPDLGELRAVAGGALVDVSTSEVCRRLAERWRDWHRPLDVGPAARAAAVGAAASGRARRGDRSRAGVRHRRAPEHAADARAAGRAAARRPAGRLGLRLGDPVAWPPRGSASTRCWPATTSARRWPRRWPRRRRTAVDGRRPTRCDLRRAPGPVGADRRSPTSCGRCCSRSPR